MSSGLVMGPFQCYHSCYMNITVCNAYIPGGILTVYLRGEGGESNKFLGGENLRPQKGRNKVGNFDANYLLDVIFQAHIFFWFAI